MTWDATNRIAAKDQATPVTHSTVPIEPGKRTLVQPQVAPAQNASARAASKPPNGDASDELSVVPPVAGINKPGFIDNSKGAPIYNKPASVGGEMLRAPLPPATRVFISGTHARLKDWWYATAYFDQTMVRGYIEAFRVNVELPEPFAELRQLKGGETVEQLAKEKFSHSVEDGHDLRFYENVLLAVNRGRAGIRGTYQDPGLLGGGSNNISLYAGHRIWLVSAEFAKSLNGTVPSGSLTGGAVAKAKRFAGHFEDILRSVTQSPHHFDDVAGEVATAIRNNLPQIIGITAGFLMAEATSMFLAAAPTGVSQAAAAVIQLGLSALGAAGMVMAGVEALNHGSAWLTIAWTAKGDEKQIAEASRSFVRMLVAIAAAALSYVGAKTNYGHAVKIANNMPTGGMPAFAVAGGGPRFGPSSEMAGTAVAIGPSMGGPAVTGVAATRLSEKDRKALGDGPEVKGVREHDAAEARAQELHDKRAAEGRKNSTVKEGGQAKLAPAATRTALAEHIPPPGKAFVEWFDSLTPGELDRLLADKGANGVKGAREVIAENIRHPGNHHEWLMVAEARQFKEWGVSMNEILEGRSLTQATGGKTFRHGGKGSGNFHMQLREMVRSSRSYPDFLDKLNRWADNELIPSHSARWPNDVRRGRYNLPENLQVEFDP